MSDMPSLEGLRYSSPQMKSPRGRTWYYRTEDGSRRVAMTRDHAGIWRGSLYAGMTTRMLTEDEFDAMRARIEMEGRANEV